MHWSLFLPWYTVYGAILIVFGILLAVWLVYIVEKARQPPWLKMIIAIILIALAIGFGLHLIMVQLAL
jgi:H+/Cl- antiporter ClcA